MNAHIFAFENNSIDLFFQKAGAELETLSGGAVIYLDRDPSSGELCSCRRSKNTIGSASKEPLVSRKIWKHTADGFVARISYLDVYSENLCTLSGRLDRIAVLYPSNSDLDFWMHSFGRFPGIDRVIYTVQSALNDVFVESSV